MERDVDAGESSMELATYHPDLDRTSARGKFEETKALVRREQEMETRRSDAKKHLYSDVWTKDPHGGAYRKVGTRDGYDALLERPDGTMKKVDPGYERPQGGPTTNFVGNHMTQGAIDLVQSELVQRDPVYQMQKIRNYQCTYRPPRLLKKEIGDIVREDKLQVLQSYTWRDEGENIVVTVPVQHIGLDLTRCMINPIFHEERTDLTLTDQEGRNFGLSLWPLSHSLDPAKSRHKPSTSKLVLILAKKDPSLKWVNLLDKNVPAQKEQILDKPEDMPSLAELRRGIRQQRANKKPGDGLLYKLPSQLESSSKSSDGDAEVVVPRPEGLCLAAALTLAKDHFVQGSYGDCVQDCTWGLELVTDADKDERDALLFQRACAFSWLGRSKDVISDCTTLLLDSPSSTSTLMQRARAYEDLERYRECLEDLDRVIALEPGNRVASESRTRVRHLLETSEKLKRQEDEMGSKTRGDLRPSVPRPVPPQFENRGKAGAVF